MTHKEAIAKLERLQEPEPWEPQIDSETFEALEMGIEALRKQIPQKPKMPFDAYYICPVCGHRVDNPYRHCSTCGQRIDWRST